MTIFRSDLVTPLPRLSQIPILKKKQMEIYLLFQKSLKNGCNNLYYHPIISISLPHVTFPSWPGKSVNPNIPQYKSYRSNKQI